MREVTDATFEQEVLRAARPVVVEFWAPWCGPCHAVEPLFEQLARDHPGIDFVKLNVDESFATSSRYGVLSLPTAILFDHGVATDPVVGVRSRVHYERAWARWLATAA